jgi:NADPH:quinone reductase-like Zn-dependent oxidoreductase
MKAVVCYRYGSPDFIAIEEIEKPVPAEGEVLLRVRAASLNPLDWHMKRGEPYIGRLMFGISKPKDPRMGRDVAGEVAAVGKNATQFKVGDAVFGACRGALAEYACALEKNLALKPGNATFEQAAAVPVAGLTALQGFRDLAGIRAGQTVLISGASGGVGTFAVQVAKVYGAEVTGVCRTASVELVRSLGADHVIDFTREDLTKSGRRYDVFFDCVGNHPLSACRRVLNPKGMYIAVGVRPDGRWLGPAVRLIKVPLLSRLGSEKCVWFVAALNARDLTALKELIEGGTVRPVVDRTYAMNEAGAAMRHLEEGHPRGKIVITVA